MVLPLEETFEYFAVISNQPGVTFSCDAKLLRPLRNDPLGTTCSRLLGPTPQLHVEAAGPAPNPGPSNPATQRSRLRLIAADRRNATFAEASFILDQGVISALRPRDLLHMVRTDRGSIGVSAIRSDQLIFAVGAITAVPLGCDFEAQIPMDLVREAEAVFRAHDTGFEFLAEYPVQIRVSDAVHIMYRGPIRLASFEGWVLHG
jgi:hypothetical protein